MKKLYIIVIISIILSGCNGKNIENEQISKTSTEYDTNNYTEISDITAYLKNPTENITQTENETLSAYENTVTESSTFDVTTETELITEGITEMERDVSSKESEITQIFLDNKADFEKIKDIITDNYQSVYVRDDNYKIIQSSKDNIIIVDDIIEKDYILNFMKSVSITCIEKPTLEAVNTPQIIFYIKYNNEYQGIKYIYEPKDDSYYDDFNKNNLSILRRIEGNWFYYYNAPPD